MAKVPEIKYTAADYQSILSALLEEVKKTDAWKDVSFRSGAGRTLLELFAYTADQLHFYMKRLASESYINSAKVRNSLINLGKLISYSIKKPSAATTTLRFRIPAKLSENITIPRGTRSSNADGYQFITLTDGIISYNADSTSVDIPGIQGRLINEMIGESNGESYQSFPLTHKDVDTHNMTVIVGKEGYTVVPDWVGYFRPAKTYTQLIHGRDLHDPATEGGDWIEEAAPGRADGWKYTITHNLDLVDPNLFSIAAFDGTSTDGTILQFTYVDPIDENVMNVYWRDNTTTLLIDIKDDLDIRIYYPTREKRIDNNSAICVVDYADEDTMKAYFGDGNIGKIPRSGEEVRAEYIRNNGADGNSGKNTINTILDIITTDVNSQVVTDITITNIEEAAGGADRESLTDIRNWAPKEIRSLKRMVTTEDYLALITRVHGVLKTQVLDVHNPGDEVVPFRTAKVYIIPVGGGDISPTLKKRIEDEIDKRKIVGTFRIVSAVTYDDINVSMDLWRSTGYTLTQVTSNIQVALNSYFAVNHATREIGDDVDYENLLSTLTDVAGVGSITLYLNGAQLDITVLDGHYPRLGTLSVTNKGILT